MSNPNVCFRIRVKLSGLTAHITAYDDAPSTGTHQRVDFEVRHFSTVIFPRGQLWVGIPAGHCTDSDYAKGAVLSCVAMRPGDIDADFFADYKPEQLAWVTLYSDEINGAREHRYCDENGNVRKSA